MHRTTRAATAVGLLVGVYLLALLVVGGLAVAVVEAATHGAGSGSTARLGVFLVVVAVAVGRGLFSRQQRTGEHDLPGVPLLEQAQPRFWAEVRAIAARAGTRPPDQIRLVAQVNAAVTEENTLLGLLQGRRRLFVGVPLLMALDADQVRSVLAHELGHYSGRHTTLAPLVYRGQQSIAGVVTRLGPGSLLGRLFGAYGRLYLRVAQAVSRQQELEADRIGAELVGAEVAASALLEIGPTDAAWQHYLATWVVPVTEEGLRPGDLFAAFGRYLDDAHTRSELDRMRAEPPEEPESPYDSHPSTAARVAALRALPAPGRAPAAAAPTSGLDLLDHTRSLLATLEDQNFADRLVVEALDVAVRATAGISCERNAVALRHALRAVGLAPGVEGVLRAAREDRLAEVGRVLVPHADDARAGEVTARLTSSLVADRLERAGRAHFALSWQGFTWLVDDTGAPVEVAAVVEGLTGGGGLDGDGDGDGDTWTPAQAADATATALAALGVPDDDAAREHEAASDAEHPFQAAAPGPGAVVAVATPVSGPGAYALYVLEGGLAVQGRGAARRLLDAVGGSSSRAAVRRAARRTPAQVLGDRRTRWLPWNQVASATWRPRRLRGGALELVSTSGEQVGVRFGVATVTAGPLLPALAHHLGDRFTRA